MAELRELSDEQLVEEHDRAAQNTVVGIRYYLDGIQRREVDRQRQMLRLTWVVTVLTVVNVVAVIVSLP